MLELIKKFKIYIQKRKEQRSNELKLQLCQEARKANICPALKFLEACQNCAWRIVK